MRLPWDYNAAQNMFMVSQTFPGFGKRGLRTDIARSDIAEAKAALDVYKRQPFALVSLRGRLGWLLFAIVWGLAIPGILFKSFAIGRFAVASVVVYVGMGWLGVFVMRPLLHALTWHGIFWIVLGGLLYTVGIVFFAFDRLSYFHALWHLFVLAGSTCHYFAVLFYVAQPLSLIHI